jgi:hypothetical protein
VLALILLLVIPSPLEAFGADLSSPGTNRDRPHANRLSGRAGFPNAAGTKQPVSVHHFARGRLIDEPPRPACTKQTAIKKPVGLLGVRGELSHLFLIIITHATKG